MLVYISTYAGLWALNQKRRLANSNPSSFAASKHDYFELKALKKSVTRRKSRR